MTRETYAVINKRSSLHFPKERWPKLWDAQSENFEDPDHRIYTDEWCDAQQRDALQNFDLNMRYFASLDRSEFDLMVEDKIASRKGMVEVVDLNAWDGKTGLYVMVLDHFKQAYVGVTSSEGGIRARVRQHWASSRAFDRLLWGSVDQSILSIDSFRALDTTRIFAARSRNPFALEEELVEVLPAKYLLNRIMGGNGRLVGLASTFGANIIRGHELDPHALSDGDE